MKMMRPPKLTAEQIEAKRDLPVFFTLEGHLRALDGWIDALEAEGKHVTDNDELDIMQAALAHLRLPLGTPVGDLLTALREAPFPKVDWGKFSDTTLYGRTDADGKLVSPFYLVCIAFSVEPTTIVGVTLSLDRAKKIAAPHYRLGSESLADTLIYAMEDGKDYDWGTAPVVWKNGHDVVVEEDETP